MDHLIGQRFNLISKSEIRYLGTLHEINPEQSTIALEDVYSFGTEDRKPDNFIPPSQQKFDYIVFRGSDVKDIKIVEDQKENKQPSPPSVPNDPAILNASRPGPPPNSSQDPRGQSPFPPPPPPPPGYPPQPQFGSYPPPPHQYGRGFGPHGGYGPGPHFYPGPPPPPGYFGPPGQGFQQPPGPFPPSPAPIGPQGQGGQGTPGPQQQTQPTQQQPRQQLPQPPQNEQQETSELPDNKASQSKQSPIPVPAEPLKPAIPTPKVAGAKTAPSRAAPVAVKHQKIAPAIPFAVNQKSFTPPVSNDGSVPNAGLNKPSTSLQAPTQAEMEEASRQAKEAVAAAMAKLTPQSAQQSQSVPSAIAMDALTKKVSEMSTNGASQSLVPAPTQPQNRGRGAFRGGRGNRNMSGGQRGKIDIPKSDFDFESANAKFSKEDLIKEAIATGSPVGETPDGIANGEHGEPADQPRKDSYSSPTVQAYNKSTSFFDNISSEAREREEGGDSRANARAMRGQEYKKNMETFGQGNVDSGYRGRGRGYRGRGRGYGGGHNRGYNRGYGARGRGGAEAAQAQ